MTELEHIREKLLSRGEVYLAVVKEGERTGDKTNERYKRAYSILKAIVNSLRKLNKRVMEEGSYNWDCSYSNDTGSLIISFTTTKI